jgi:hypothetical protein
VNAIEQIIARLQNYPDTTYQSGPDFIRVLPHSPDGFTVELVAAKNHYTVHFNGWHEDFKDEQGALNCFAFGLSTECRLKEYCRWGIAYKWTVEYKEGNEWIEESTTGTFLPFFGKPEVRYLQNELILNKE